MKIPSKTDEQLKEFVIDYMANKIFTSVQVHNDRDLGMVFLPLALGGLAEFTQEEIQDIGLVYEYTSEAGPRSINGYPMFTSCRFMTISDWERCKAAITKEFDRQKEIIV